MAKVIFELDDSTEGCDVELIVHRKEIYYMISQVRRLCNDLYNGKLYAPNDIITVKDNKVLTEDDYEHYKEIGDYPVTNTHQYISTDYIINNLQNVLDVYKLRDY